MKYKEIFKSWWFYALVIGYFLFSVFTNLQKYDYLFFIEYVGILLGSFIGVLFFVSIIWGLSKLFKLIIPKKR